MATTAIIDHRALGAAVLSRLEEEEVEVPKSVAAHVAAFKSAHDGFEKAAVATDAARAKRDKALAMIGRADETLDATIDPLADKMVGAGLGSRQKPLGKASPFSPTKLKALPYKTELEAVRTLVANVTAAKPPADVKKCADECLKAADAVATALEGLTGPQAAFHRARGARDALLVGWTKAFAKLRINAKAAWHDDRATYEAMFAAPEKVQRPVKKRKKPANAKPDEGDK